MWNQSVTEVGEDRMLEPGPMSDWSLGGASAVDSDWTSHLRDGHLPSVRAWLATRG